VIGVTGGLGSGKSTVSKILAAHLEAELTDTDELCRIHLQPGASGYEQVQKVLGQNYFLENGELNREFLRQQVFADDQIKEILESILHPLVERDVLAMQRRCNETGCHLVVEVPLLFEVGWQKYCETTVVVYVPEVICTDRVILRSGLSRQAIKRIFSSQMDITDKRILADYCIDNSGTYASTMQQVHWTGRSIIAKKRKQLG